jgi:hypothetical protein
MYMYRWCRDCSGAFPDFNPLITLFNTYFILKTCEYHTPEVHKADTSSIRQATMAEWSKAAHLSSLGMICVIERCVRSNRTGGITFSSCTVWVAYAYSKREGRTTRHARALSGVLQVDVSSASADQI